MKKSAPSLISKRLQCFVNFIAPDTDESPRIKEHFQQIKARIEKHASNEGYTVASVQYGGSYAKRTGLRRYMTGGSEVEGQDVDVAVILEPHDKKGRAIERSLVPRFKQFLLNHWEKHLVGHTKSSATLTLKDEKLRFDVVPLVKTGIPGMQRLYRTTPGDVKSTSIQGHIEFVRNLNGQGKHIHFNNGLRLVKWWRYNQQITSRIFRNDKAADKVPSFLLDLLCARAYLDLPKKNNYPEMLYDWFRYLYDVCQQRKPVVFGNDRGRSTNNAIWQVIDPKDFTNNVVAEWHPHQVNELARWFQRGRDLMIQAIHFDQDGAHDRSMQCLTKLFGPSMKTACKHLK